MTLWVIPFSKKGIDEPMIYELLYIIPSKFSDSEIDGIRGKVASQLETAGAKIEKTEDLGKIKLAYPVKKERHGSYILIFMDVDGDALQKI
ncbi:30S ribosomal protein S6, partial [Patescibacteria group bacterium]|nr:30S ribosomal protein S6 [Patescibacteria group bacterium]